MGCVEVIVLRERRRRQRCHLHFSGDAMKNIHYFLGEVVQTSVGGFTYSVRGVRSQLVAYVKRLFRYREHRETIGAAPEVALLV